MSVLLSTLPIAATALLAAPPAPPREIENIAAFARLYGVVRFFYINGGGPGGNQRGGDGQAPTSSSQDATGDLLAWVRSSCSAVPLNS